MSPVSLLLAQPGLILFTVLVLGLVVYLFHAMLHPEGL